MSRFVSVETPGGPIWVEVPDQTEMDGVELVANRDQIHQTFEQSAQALKKNAQYLLDTLKGLGPTELEVTFGISVGVEMGTPLFALAQANGEANYSVTLRWQGTQTDTPS